jgi:hypothetical protein
VIFNLRGSNGSGKSWAIRRWFGYAPRPLLGRALPEAYQLTVPGVKRPVFVLGPYDRPCGGCDNFIPYALNLDMLRKYAPRGHVLFEGLLISHSYGTVGALLETFTAADEQSVVIFLTTPVERCIANVKQRRLARGDNRPLDTKNLVGHYHGTAACMQKWPATSKIRLMQLAPEAVHDAVLAMIRANERPKQP